MALEIQRGRSKWWYGRVTINGTDVVKNLGVEITGKVPATLRDFGDPAFERSRAKAQAALEELQNDFRKRSAAEELVQTIHEIRTGSRIRSLALAEIGSRWQAVPRRRPLSSGYSTQVLSVLNRFIDYLNNNHRAVREMADVQAGMACTFLKAEDDRGISAKTYNNTLIFLRSCFEALKEEAGIPKNPFIGIPTKEEDTIFRKPFETDELAAIIAAAKGDEFAYPIIVTAICTAMRRGDCCLLPKTAVDLPNGFVMVKTSKTKELVQIPIFPLLHGVLAAAKPGRSLFMFPEQATMYQCNPDGITYRVRQILRKAGFFDPEDSTGSEEKKKSRGAVHQERENGLRKASVRDFYSFRVTWVTLALTAGVPLEIVQKVTGHRTVAIVTKHYFQPGREEFRRTLVGMLPSIIGGGPAAKPIDLAEIRAKLVAMDQATWRTVRDELLAKLPAEAKRVLDVPVEKTPALLSA